MPGPTLALIDTEGASLWYHPPTKIVHHELHRFVYGKELQAVWEKGAEALEKYGACKWLSDDRCNGPIKPADEQWAINVWAPRVLAAGWKYWAVVLPQKVLGQRNMKRSIETYARLGVTARAFTDPEAAMRWLVDPETTLAPAAPRDSEGPLA